MFRLYLLELLDKYKKRNIITAKGIAIAFNKDNSVTR